MFFRTLPGPCQNGASCMDEVNGYTCNCVLGYNGTHCENNIDECSSGPCQNGASCLDKVNGYTCNCVLGYNGTHCENNIDECSSGPCQNGASCVDGYTATVYLDIMAHIVKITLMNVLQDPAKMVQAV